MDYLRKAAGTVVGLFFRPTEEEDKDDDDMGMEDETEKEDMVPTSKKRKPPPPTPSSLDTPRRSKRLCEKATGDDDDNEEEEESEKEDVIGVDDCGGDDDEESEDEEETNLTDRQKKRLEYFDQLWMQHYNDLKGYRRKHGHCNVRVVGSGPLGTWVNNQRQTFAKGKMRDDRKSKLDKIGFAWSMKGVMNKQDEYDDEESSVDEEEEEPLSLNERREQLWLERYEDLKAYRKKHGHCNVPQLQGALGRWVKYQRACFAENSSRYPGDHKKLLDKIGFAWRLQNKEMTIKGDDDDWLNQKKSPEEQEHDFDHSSVDEEDENSGVNDEEEEDEDGIGGGKAKGSGKNPFKAHTKNDEKWLAQYNQLKDYMKKHGHCNPPRKQELSLFYWVSNNRLLFAKNKAGYPKDRKKCLDQLGFEWVRK